MASLLEALSKLDEAVKTLNDFLHRAGLGNSGEPSTDKFFSAQAKQNDIKSSCSVYYGRVVDVIPGTHWYKVQPDNIRTSLPCVMLGQSSLSPGGVRVHSVLQPNSGVYFIMNPASTYGCVIGVEPDSAGGKNMTLADYITLCSSNTTATEGQHSFPTNLAMNGSVIDWSSGRPRDATSAGEYGIFADSGVGVFVDTAMAFIRADENCGMWVFYRDQLTRIAGHNLQIRTSGSEEEQIDDEGEFSAVRGYTPYPWEALGVSRAESNSSRSFSAAERQVSSSHYSGLEPEYDDQQPFFRFQEHHGYVGQGFRQIMAAPQYSESVYRFSSKTVFPGLWEQHVSLAGDYLVRSARSIRLVKQAVFPVIKVLRRPEDAQGDNPDNYKASSVFGSGPDHRINDFVTSGPDPSMNRVLGQMDRQSFFCNWVNQVGAHYHKLDFFTPEETQVQSTFSLPTINRPNIGALYDNTFIPVPEPVKVKVDHRQEAEVYPTYSFVELTEDGSVEIGDASGSSIRMVGGNIIIAAAGDIMLQAGRRIVNLSGTDFIARTERSLELSTTTGDVRIRGKKNCEILAQDGGLLLESQAQSSGWEGWVGKVGHEVVGAGVQIKASKSSVVSWANTIYTRAGIDEDGRGIFLDAGKGASTIATNSRDWQRWMKQSSTDFYGEGDGLKMCYWDGQGNLLSGSCTVLGSALVTGFLTAGSSITSVNGHIVTAQAETYDYLVGGLSEEGIASGQQSLETANSSAQTLSQEGFGLFEAVWTQGFYQSGQCGDDETIGDVVFSFCTSQQYRAENFRLYETRWQQMARLSGLGLSVWREEPVPKKGDKTFPFPGEGTITSGDSFYQQDLKLFDWEQQVSKDRSDPSYEEPRFEEPSASSIIGSYTILSGA